MRNRVNVKPLMHWIIYRGYTVRITERASTHVAGVMTTPDGPITFRYDPASQTIYLPEKSVTINQYGWEVDPPAT